MTLSQKSPCKSHHIPSHATPSTPTHSPTPYPESTPSLPYLQALALEQQRERTKAMYARVPAHGVPSLEATLLRHMPGGVAALRHALNQV